jgi:hypothetical protein
VRDPAILAPRGALAKPMRSSRASARMRGAMSEGDAVRTEVETLLALVRERYGDRLDVEQWAGVRTAIEGIVQAARALRAVRLTNADEPGQPFAAYRAEP